MFRVTFVFTAFLLVLESLKAKENFGSTVGDKVRMLNELTSKRSFIKLNAEKFKALGELSFVLEIVCITIEVQQKLPQQ